VKPERCPQQIGDIFRAWNAKPRKQIVDEGRVYLVPSSEILARRCYKILRTEDKALPPGKIRNKSPQDVEDGQEKYRKLRESIRRDGFDPLRPIVFLVRKSAEKPLIHQGHHRLAVAFELKLPEIPVLFVFDRHL
jgi:hypothetical protein